ncbi:MAG: S9 family peptidase [Burkholderiales bacterium]|nr:S9 family peptidase [Burkholderiales bacterium]
MMKNKLSYVIVLSFACTMASLSTAPVAFAEVAAKKLISHDVYANWRSIQHSVLSRDGAWAAYALVGQESDGEVVVKNLQDGREWRSARGHNPVFSFDGRYLAFAIAPTRAELDKAKKDKKKPEDAPKPGVGVMDLATGKVESLTRVKRFSFPEDGGNLLAVLHEPVKSETKPAKEAAVDAAESDDDQQVATADAAGGAAKKKEAGTELIVWDVASGKKQNLTDVADFVWNRDGSALAFAVSIVPVAKPEVNKEPTKKSETEAKAVAKPELKEASAENAAATVANAVDKVGDKSAKEGVYLWSAANQQVQTLLSGAGTYKHVRFDEAGQQLAFVTNRDEQAKKKATNEKSKTKDSSYAAFAVYFWRAGEANANLIVDAQSKGMPALSAPSEYAELAFSQDGQRLFLSTAEIPKPEAKDAPEPMKVDLWHWKDPELQSVQKVNAEKDKQRSFRAVVHLNEMKFVQLAHKNMPQIVVNDNAQIAMGISSQPYRHLMSWDSLYYDTYAVNLQNGQAKMLIEKALFMPSLSPQGKFILHFDEKRSQWMAYATDDGKKLDLTSQIKTQFEDRSRDIPSPKNAYGVAGWTENDASVVLYDQFDLWEVNLATRAARNLSSGYGRKNQVELRYVYLGDTRRAAANKALPSDQAWILSADHEVKHDSGYMELDVKAGTAPKALIYGAKMITGLSKAKNSDRVLFTQQSFTEFPDVWTASLNDLSSAQKISAANPQQANYNWGTQELIDYVSADGKKLKALLAKPENFDPKKKYPMMVYIYEKMTDNLHRYVPPAPAQNINITRYVSNGYIVLRPDIVYETGYPGKSAMNTVLPAIKKVLAQGYVDPAKVGIQGHSWGAYQINYLISHSNMFRAAEAGASMANMISGYGGIRWGAGVSRAFQYERGQSRIGGTPWDSKDKYVENSPIFSIDKVKTPYLTVHNDDDDAVPWYQAIEFFSALRRLNKEAYWFNYNGEKHGLRERDHIKHFTVHMGEFFDHYLLDKPRPEWMDKPVPYLERGKRDVMGLFKPVITKTD